MENIKFEAVLVESAKLPMVKIDRELFLRKELQDKFENYCPDYGCGINFENDGGNGFCINCASEH